MTEQKINKSDIGNFTIIKFNSNLPETGVENKKLICFYVEDE